MSDPLLIDARERLAQVEVRIQEVRDVTSRIDSRLASIERQLVFGKGWMGAFIMFASLVGAGATFIFNAVKSYVLSGGN